MRPGTRRVQFVISGPFLLLLLFAAGFLTAGLWLLIHQPPPPRPQTPPYYVNRTSTAIRPCYQCVAADGKLAQRSQWKLGKPVDVPSGEQWWFAPVEDRPIPVSIDGIPMLAMHPAKDRDKPWYGFDQHRVFLAVFQDLDGRFNIEHPVPPPPQAPTPTPATPTPDTTPPEKPQQQP